LTAIADGIAKDATRAWRTVEMTIIAI